MVNRDRARGAFVGLAIGDAMGAPTEGMTIEAIRQTFGRVTALAPDAAGTDDTEYAVLCARGILEHGSALTAADVAATWMSAVSRQQGGFYGAGFSEMVAIANLGAGLTPPTSGLLSYERWSDGAAMRVTPIGIFAAGSADEACRLAAIDASVSHSADGVYCAQAIAAGVSTALVSDDHRAVIDAAVAALPADSWSRRLVDRALDIAACSASADEASDELYREISLFHYPWADAAPEATALALGLFSAARGDFRDALLASVNIGRDSDTIAAMTGALAGALIGYDALPREWSEPVLTVHGRCIVDTAGTDLLDIADRLVDRSARERDTTQEGAYRA
ncbi:ADP-ribosylglycohydrolase family protein [Leifsonia poae]|uniref:ADP-ribosylglycohydrolase family protein n=1 Tax=Leifsonia poae TaxID=110933 RepID=UPI001CBAA132|nr:ADP-ribosylglycohydrolase family protein [Leifsonia poae]